MKGECDSFFNALKKLGRNPTKSLPSSPRGSGKVVVGYLEQSILKRQEGSFSQLHSSDNILVKSFSDWKFFSNTQKSRNEYCLKQ